MALESGFFNSVNGDRKYNAEQIGRYFENILSNGIFKKIANNMLVTSNGDMTLTVAPGAGLIECHWFRALAAETVTIPTANAALPRFDTVVARLDLSSDARSISLAVVSGTPASAPVEPAPTRDETVCELVLALVYVPAGASAIAAENITDVRGNDWYCGYVHSLTEAPILKKHTGAYTTATDGMRIIPVNVAAYEPELDIVNVYVNGFHMANGRDYTIDSENKNIVLTNAVERSTVVTFEVYKAMQADDVETPAQVVANLLEENTALKSRVADLEIDSGWVELPWESGASSNANWTARIRRVGKSIFLRGLCTSVAANETTLAIVPEEYRPTMGGHAYTGFCSNSAGGNTRAARMFIETTGEVVFRSAGSAAPSSGDYISISTSWLID